MSHGDFELPPEALQLIEKVRGLEVRAEQVKTELAHDLAGIREAAAKERADVEKDVAAQRKEADDHLRWVRDEVSAERARLAERREAFEAELGMLAEDRQALEALLSSRVRGFEFIATAWADYEAARADEQAVGLEEKEFPAYVAADVVRSKGKELAEARRELKRAQWVLSFYEFQFPWLSELRDLEEENTFVAPPEDEPVDTDDGLPPDPAQKWLSVEEFRALPEVKRNQRALDRYLRSRKSAWQLGRDYERYIGYLREIEGARVRYQGIFAGLEDLGRDLLAERDGAIEVIQCKRWPRHKTIHEKHVFQLFGTVVAARIEYPDHQVSGTFTTTTTLSERAHQFAQQLGVRVEEGVPLGDYPQIKCNVGRGGERIYHLPFDQQYDATVISLDRGECWVATTAEAEGLGFRRAWRWHGISATTHPG